MLSHTSPIVSKETKQKIKRAKQLFSLEPFLYFTEKSTDGTSTDLLQSTSINIKEGAYFLELIQIITGATASICHLNNENETTCHLVIDLNALNDKRFKTLEVNKDQILHQVVAFLNQLNGEPESFEWVMTDGTIFMRVDNADDLKNMSDKRFSNFIKDQILDYCKRRALELNLENILSDKEIEIFNEYYIAEGEHERQLLRKNIMPHYYPLHLSPHFLVMFTIMNHLIDWDHKLTNNDYKVDYDKPLGKGGYATTFLATFQGNIKIAVKISSTSSTEYKNKLSYNSIRREERIYRYLDHIKGINEDSVEGDFILNFYGCENKGLNLGIYLALELGNGTLDDLLYQNSKLLNTKERYHFATGIVYGLKFLHYSGIVYCDLKPENVLIVDGNAKLSDFGLSKFTNEAIITGGSILYSGPETLTTQKRSQASDIYNLGMTFWELVANERPYKRKPKLTSEAELYNHVVTQKGRPFAPEKCPIVVWNLINSCWKQNPANRPKIDVVIDKLESITEEEMDNTLEKIIKAPSSAGTV